MTAFLRPVFGALLMFFLIVGFSFTQKNKIDDHKGTLFIIGGGENTPELIKEMLLGARLLEGTAGISKVSDKYILILPMANANPKKAYNTMKKLFNTHSSAAVHILEVTEGDVLNNAQKDSILNASLIYIPGGSQVNFLKRTKGSGLVDVLHEAYENGVSIAGTSAGASLMSEEMLTGYQKHLPDTLLTTYSKLTATNLETKKGLGLIKNAIIDQHFVERSRYNRLISVCYEYPGKIGVGLAESTAIKIQGDYCQVIGEGQVIVMKNMLRKKSGDKGQIGFSDISMSAYIRGDSFTLSL